MKDEKIVQLIRAGQHSKALDKLYKNFPACRKLVVSKGGSDEDAADIFQEALIIFCEKAAQPDFSLTCQVGTYVYSVCRFIWKDKQQKSKRYIHVDSQDWDFEAEEVDIAQFYESETRFKHLDQILVDLGEKCREILTRFYFNKESIANITQALGYSTEASAKNQKYKCMERAKKMAVEYSSHPKNLEA